MSSLRTAGPRSAAESLVFFIVSLGLLTELVVELVGELVVGLGAGLISTSFGLSGIGL